jgi:hypothetical protein
MGRFLYGLTETKTGPMYVYFLGGDDRALIKDTRFLKKDKNKNGVSLRK